MVGLCIDGHIFLKKHFIPGVSTFGTFHNKAVFLQLSSRDATFECACTRDKLPCLSIKMVITQEVLKAFLNHNCFFKPENHHHGPLKQDKAVWLLIFVAIFANNSVLPFKLVRTFVNES